MVRGDEDGARHHLQLDRRASQCTTPTDQPHGERPGHQLPMTRDLSCVSRTRTTPRGRALPRPRWFAAIVVHIPVHPATPTRDTEREAQHNHYITPHSKMPAIFETDKLTAHAKNTKK